MQIVFLFTCAVCLFDFFFLAFRVAVFFFFIRILRDSFDFLYGVLNLLHEFQIVLKLFVSVSELAEDFDALDFDVQEGVAFEQVDECVDASCVGLQLPVEEILCFPVVFVLLEAN